MRNPSLLVKLVLRGPFVPSRGVLPALDTADNHGWRSVGVESHRPPALYRPNISEGLHLHIHNRSGHTLPTIQAYCWHNCLKEVRLIHFQRGSPCHFTSVLWVRHRLLEVLACLTEADETGNHCNSAQPFSVGLSIHSVR